MWLLLGRGGADSHGKAWGDGCSGSGLHYEKDAMAISRALETLFYLTALEFYCVAY